MTSLYTNSSNNRDLKWDEFVASLYRVWEYAPDFSPTGPSTLTGRRVLVVDVDTEHNQQVGEALTRIGTSKTMVESFEQAFHELGKQSFDIVICGTQLFDEDACEFCQSVCDSLSTLSIPIILLMNDDRPEMIWQARRAGAKFCLRKPCDPYVLLTLMSAALEPIE
jgi:DNA-binding response OmpR family regulator